MMRTVPSRRKNLFGSLWMTASMAAFSVEDVCLKLASGALPVSAIMVVFGGIGLVLFALICIATDQSPFQRGLWHPSMVLRFWSEVFGRLFFTLSLVLTAISSTVAILQATPIVVVAGAALVFREKVSRGRWFGIAVGLGGVLLILRPSSTGFSELSILAVLGMLGLALRDLATRAAPAVLQNSVLGFWSFASVVVAGLLYGLWEAAPLTLPAPSDLPFLAGASMAGALGYIALTEAMRTGDVSVVTPFRYTRLVCGTVFGVMLFGETLDAFDVAGTVVVIGSGLAVLSVRTDARRAASPISTRSSRGENG